MFLDERDYGHYYGLLLRYSKKHSMRILGYCFMPNHIHIIAVPSCEETFEQVFRETQTRYGRYFCRKYGRSGHVWGNRYFSCPMDENHTGNALAYVELNPVRAGMVMVAAEYPWSSACAHTSPSHRDPMLRLDRWFGYWTAEEWNSILTRIAEDRDFASRFRVSTQKGDPLGDADFKRKVFEEIRSRRRDAGSGDRPAGGP